MRHRLHNRVWIGTDLSLSMLESVGTIQRARVPIRSSADNTQDARAKDHQQSYSTDADDETYERVTWLAIMCVVHQCTYPSRS